MVNEIALNIHTLLSVSTMKLNQWNPQDFCYGPGCRRVSLNEGDGGPEGCQVHQRRHPDRRPRAAATEPRHAEDRLCFPPKGLDEPRDRPV